MPPKRGSRRSITKEKLTKDVTVNESTSLQKMEELKMKKHSLQNKLNRFKKELAQLRVARTEKQFSVLMKDAKNAQLSTPTELNSEWKTNVELWSKYTNFVIENATCEYLKDENLKRWHVKGYVKTLNFTMNVIVAYDATTKQGFVKDFDFNLPFPSSAELTPWIKKSDGNIEQILKSLRAYQEMDVKRTQDLEQCCQNFSNLVTVKTSETTGEKIIDISLDDVCYFEIKWKLQPSMRIFGSIKNVGRIACTKEGDQYIKANTDLATIRKRLNSNPLEVIQMLAKGITPNGVTS